MIHGTMDLLNTRLWLSSTSRLRTHILMIDVICTTETTQPSTQIQAYQWSNVTNGCIPRQYFKIRSPNKYVYFLLQSVSPLYIHVITTALLYWKKNNRYFGKNCGSRWNAAWCCISSGSALFAKIKTTFRDGNTSSFGTFYLTVTH